MILCDHAKLAFNEGSIIEETINLRAAISAKSLRDTRKAIKTPGAKSHCVKKYKN